MKKLNDLARNSMKDTIFHTIGLNHEDTDRLVDDWCAIMGEEQDSALFRLMFNAMVDGMRKKDLYTWIEAGDA